jgi:hypothetical protein
MNRHSPSLSGLSATILMPLDKLRCFCLKALGAPAKLLVRRRDLRVIVAGCGIVCSSLAATVISPFWLLALGPVLLGTPHLVADLRYLVFRPRLHERRWLWVPVGGPLLLAGLGFHSLASGLVACAAMGLLAHGPVVRKIFALGAIASLMLGAWAVGQSASLIFSHLHNFIAVMLWWCWRPRADWRSLGVPLFFLAVSVLILLGVIGPWATGFAWQPGGLGASYHISFLAPGVDQPWALRLVLLFAFAQSVHYGIWLRLIPEDDRPQATPRTFAASARALRSDLGMPLLAVSVAVALGIALWAVFDLATARENYLRMALFHGHLELIAATWLFIERPAPFANPLSIPA